MTKRILITLLFSPLALIVSCSGATAAPAAPNTTAASPPGATLSKPLIDTRVPAAFETATFALG